MNLSYEVVYRFVISCPGGVVGWCWLWVWRRRGSRSREGGVEDGSVQRMVPTEDVLATKIKDPPPTAPAGAPVPCFAALFFFFLDKHASRAPFWGVCSVCVSSVRVWAPCTHVERGCEWEDGVVCFFFLAPRYY